MYFRPAMTMITMMPTLSATTNVVAAAEPRTPTYSSTVMAATISTAGTLMRGPEATTRACASSASGAVPREAGRGVSARKEVPKIGGPVPRAGESRDRVFEQQVPADEPGERLAEGCIGVAVGAARHRQEGRELGVTQRRESAAEGGDQQRQRDRRAGMIGGDRAGEHENARADGGAQANGDERPRAHHLLQAVLAGCVCRIDRPHRAQLPQQ